MPLSKNVTVISNNITLTAGGGPTTSSSATFTSGWHKMVHIKLTNGATAPSSPATAEVQASPDDSNFYTLTGLSSAELIGSTDNNGEKSYTILTFAAVQYMRVVWTHGPDGSDITARAEVSEVGEIAESYTDTTGNNLVGTADDSETATRIIGNVAHDSIDSGNPIKVGGIARTSNPTAVTDSDRVDAFYDDLGKQITLASAPRDLVVHNNITLSNTSETTLLSAGGSGVFRDLYMLVMSNDSDNTVTVDIRDSTAGTVRLSVSLSGFSNASGEVRIPFVAPFDPPWPQTTANNDWTAQLSTTATVYVTAWAIETV